MKLASNEQGVPQPEICYFFFRSEQKAMASTHAAAYRSILAQILHMHQHDDHLLDKIAFAMGQGDGQLHASPSELTELLQLCLQGCDNMVLILDGVDECQNAEDLVSDFLRIVAARSGSLKLIFFSRPNVSKLSSSVPEERRVAMNKIAVSKDIEIYLLRRIEELSEDGLLPRNSDCARLVRHLTCGADGMFLWAHLMITYLHSVVLTPMSRTKTILSVTMPEGLEKMYCRILAFIQRSTKAQRDLAKRVFTWLLFARRDLQCRELQQAIIADESRSLYDDQDEICEFRKVVLMACAGLVESSTAKEAGPENCTFQFVHLTVKEFLTTPSMNAQISPSMPTDFRNLVPSPFIGRIQLAKCCLHFLNASMPAKPLSGRFDQRTTKPSLDWSFPFLTYAAVSWIGHLHETMGMNVVEEYSMHQHEADQSLSELCIVLTQFISQNLVVMAWIETFYTTRESGWADFSDLKDWASWATGALLPKSDLKILQLLNDLQDLAKDLSSLDDQWQYKLRLQPNAIWSETTVFTPSRFWTASAAMTLTSLMPTHANEASLSSRFLRMISCTSLDGTTVGVLSVWSSRYSDTS
jgi:hypothetical protein